MLRGISESPIRHGDCICTRRARHGHISGSEGLYRGPVLYGPSAARTITAWELRELEADGTITGDQTEDLRASLDSIPGFQGARKVSITQFRREVSVEAWIMVKADMPGKITVSPNVGGTGYLVIAYCRNWRELPALTARCQEIEAGIRAGRITSGFKELRG